MAIVPFYLLGASCPSESEKNKGDTFHPCWYQINELEDKLPKDQCNVTKFGLRTLRFYAPDHRKCFNSENYCAKFENNIVQIDIKTVDWVLTPNFYGSVTVEKFPKTMQTGMKYMAYNNKESGIPPSFLEEWLAIDPIDYRDAILIVSTGLDSKLDESILLKQALKDKKEKSEIKDYKILQSKYAVKEHNKCVKNGEKVFTFIHTLG